MRKEIREWTTWVVSVILLFAITGCELNFGNVKPVSERSSVKSVVTKCIDEELETILPYLDEETQITIESGRLRGDDIVTKAMNEESGENYINFCYAVQETVVTQNTDVLLNSAKEILPTSAYLNIEQKVADMEHHLGDMSRSIAKALPANQQEAFYSDLRALVVKTAVLLVAGIVYAAMPTAVVWGKVSAAAALSIAAGVVASVVMDVYGHYSLGFELQTDIEELVTNEKSFETWLDSFKKEPEAYYALATSITSLAASMEINPVVTGIILVVFAAYNVWDTIQSMQKIYNFNA